MAFDPVPVAPVLAAGIISALVVELLLKLLPSPANPFPTFPMATLANHGVNQTLSISLSGKIALVTAYAVATSTTIFVPASDAFHALARFVVVIDVSSDKPNHCFRLK